jgi:hypothetical protein
MNSRSCSTYQGCCVRGKRDGLTRFLPPTCLPLETHFQYKRNPARCQFTTVLGVTKTRGCLHPDQHILNATQNSLCRAVNRRRGRWACTARSSRTRSSRERKALTNQPRKCRSDAIIAGIISGKPESSFAPSHSFCRCTTFWRGTVCEINGRYNQTGENDAWLPQIDVTERGTVISSMGLFSVAARLSPSASEFL